VKVLRPDDYLRPEMNATVAFIEDANPAAISEARPFVYVPPSVIRNNAVFVIANGKAARRDVRVGTTTPQGLRIEAGLTGGEDLINNPPSDLKEGDRVRKKQGQV
jgi:HlyD family secretion protein